jgi:hypothetical protein
LPSSQATASAKARWISSPMMRMLPPSLFVRTIKDATVKRYFYDTHD